MEKKLKMLFDFQHFQENSRLAQVIAETESNYGSSLDDDDLSFVSAAGEFTPPTKQRKDGDDYDT